jgi:hypothetical protein
MSAHEPSGRQTFDVVHCACAVHFWHCVFTQAGVAPEHAPGSLVVHWTHVMVAARSQTAVGAMQSPSPLHDLGPGASHVSRQSLFGLPTQ